MSDWISQGGAYGPGYTADTNGTGDVQPLACCSGYFCDETGEVESIEC